MSSNVPAHRRRHRHLALRPPRRLRDDLQPACAELPFAESGDGYAQPRKRLELLARRHPGAALAVRVDVAGQYADNLPHFLHRLAAPRQGGVPLAGRLVTVSTGDPQRNKSYRAVRGEEEVRAVRGEEVRRR
jgi:hypothetical protein